MKSGPNYTGFNSRLCIALYNPSLSRMLLIPVSITKVIVSIPRLLESLGPETDAIPRQSRVSHTVLFYSSISEYVADQYSRLLNAYETVNGLFRDLSYAARVVSMDKLKPSQGKWKL